MPLAVPSATHSLISGSLWTESFQRYGSSTPTLKMPPIGRRPITERSSLARRPLFHGGVSPRRAWLSVNWMAASSPADFMLGGPLGMKRAAALARLHGRIPALPQLDQPRRAPFEVLPPRLVARVVRARQVQAGRGLEVLLAVHAVTVAALRRPAVGEDPVDLVARDDLAMHLIHELEVVGAERARDP